MTKQPCKPYLLSKSSACELWVCIDCGTVTMHLGSVSLRLGQEVFKQVSETMQDGIQRLKHYDFGPNKLSVASENKH